MSNQILNVVERAYQGTLEEQDDQALWLVHALKNAGGDHAILLRGPAVAYGVKGQQIGSFEIAGSKAGNPPRIDEDLAKLLAKGVPVYAVREDVEKRGIGSDELVSGLQLVGRTDVAKLYVESKRIFAW